MEFAQIWVIVRAESCWAALILYRIGNRTRYTNTIQNQNRRFVWLAAILGDDTS